MSALHAMGEQGGWPLTMFLTPDGTPYWGGTYFPPKPSYGRPAFIQVLQALENSFRQKQDAVKANTTAIRNHLENLSKNPENTSGPLDETLFDEFVQRTLSIYDPVHGGTRGAPKFPNAPILEAWARKAGSNPESEAAKAFLHTITKISQGGIYDHLRGGISRYSVDEKWLAPHFEKMLYDNAHYIRHLTIAWKLTGDDLFRQRIEQTIGWLTEEMKLENGTFASSLDADSEGEEGKFYVWSRKEIEKIAKAQSEIFTKLYDVTDGGNWEGKNILNRLDNVSVDEEAEKSLSKIRKTLLAHRNKRTPPDLDDKVLSDWNGYLVRALVEAGIAFGNKKWIALAKDAFHFIAESKAENHELVHSWRQQITVKPALSTDYASMINAALSLYEASNDEVYINLIFQWITILKSDYSDGAGGFFLTSKNNRDLLVRPRSDFDEANPSGASQLLEAFIRYAHISGDEKHLKDAEALASNLQAVAKTNQGNMAGFMNALHSWFRHKHVLVIASSKKSAAKLINTANHNPQIAKSILIRSQQSIKSHLGLQLPTRFNGPTAIVCSGQSCSAPVTSPEELDVLLNET